MTETTSLFRSSLESVLGRLDWLPVADGHIHRFHVLGDRPGSRNGWYLLHADARPAGCFGSWKTGGYHSWSGARRDVVIRHKWSGERQTTLGSAAELEHRQRKAMHYAQWLWANAKPADRGHPYLLSKQVPPYGLRQKDQQLLVPLICESRLLNLQRIAPDGGKRFLKGGRIKGCHALLGTLVAGARLYLCEGWATGATLHAATGCPVACAMNAGNLLAAGQQLWQEYPDCELVVAGDDDRLTPGNPGRRAATDTAEALGCGLVFPPWSGAEPLSLTDFNDLAVWRAQP
ncbi:MAG TPA: toprim domain-containing protein [Pseudomonas sp.]|nr:toprim domain-containing protein [Pseudomonas sp.]